MTWVARYVVAITGLLVLVGCDFTEAETAQPEGYLLYVGSWDSDEVFVVDTDSNELVRTLTRFSRVWSLAVTKDGRKLYVQGRSASREDGYVHVVNTQTWERDTLLAERAKAFVTPQGDALFLTQYPHEEQQILGRIDTDKDQITFLDTLDLYYRVGSDPHADIAFSPTEPVFYATNNDRKLFAYDYGRREVTQVYESLRDPLRIIISLDGTRLFVAGGPVLDLENDRIVGFLGGNHLSSLALDPSGQFVYVTDPASYWSFRRRPSGAVSVFDTDQYAHVDSIDFREASPGPGGPPLLDDIVVSPDGKRAYVSNWYSVVFVVDLTERKVIDLIQPRELGIQTIPLAIGPKP